MKTAVKSGLAFVLLLSLLISQSGCTYALWTDGTLDAYKEPAPTPNLHLYQSQKKNDFLVVYTEYSERSDSVRTRAYWLNKNAFRVEDKHAPAFARKKAEDHLPPVLIFYSPPRAPQLDQTIYAVCNTNFDTITLFSDNHVIGSYNLPVYKDRTGTVEKVALTPVTVTADATMVAGVAAFYVAYAWAQSGQTFQIHR